MKEFFVLGIVFIVLKLLGIISWSWWLVTLPIYGSIIWSVYITIIVFVFLLIGQILEKLGIKLFSL